MRKNEAKSSDHVAVLDKALDLLEALAERPDQTVAELAEAADVTKAATYRILATLEARGYVVTYERVRRYSIGHAFHMYLQAARTADRLIQSAQPEMRALLDVLGETVNLGVLARRGVLYLNVLESTQSLRTISQVGSFDALHSTALGKAVLSCMPDEDRRAALADVSLVPRTRHTVTDPAELDRRISRATELGYAVDDEENEIGMRCVAAAIVNADGWPLAAISVSGPSSRMTADAIETIGARLIETTGRLSERLAQSPAPQHRAAERSPDLHGRRDDLVD